MSAFIVDYIRTPIGRYGGALAQVRTDDLAAIPVRALLARNGWLAPSRIDEVVMGCTNQAGEDNRNVARMASLLAGIPVEVPALTVNRLCGSGMDAVAIATRAIALGEAEIAIAGGVESMSRAPFVMPKAAQAFSRTAEIHDTTIGWRFVNPLIEQQYGIDSMPETAENVAAQYGVTRADQDAFALRSQSRAAMAQANGRLAAEITAVEIRDSKGAIVSVARDEHPRATTLDRLAGLPALVRAGGGVTAGNASGINDGAAALLLVSESVLEREKRVPLARISGFASAGVAPRVMGMGPVPAVRKLTGRTGTPVNAYGIIELNEAFAAQALAVLRSLNISDDDARVNPNGGAIALGHPLGASGARLVGTAALEMQRHGISRGLATMCVGVGQGVAMELASP
jgi:acetyl-CoA acyltransferase